MSNSNLHPICTLETSILPSFFMHKLTWKLVSLNWNDYCNSPSATFVSFNILIKFLNSSFSSRTWRSLSSWLASCSDLIFIFPLISDAVDDLGVIIAWWDGALVEGMLLCHLSWFDESGRELNVGNRYGSWPIVLEARWRAATRPPIIEDRTRVRMNTARLSKFR